jgi:peptidoglycan-N-acetylglucosamine deacetylase
VFSMTFDDGPTPGVTDNVLATLRNSNIKATFLVCGNMVDKSPWLLQQELSARHSIHSHSYSHTSLITLSQEGVYYEMKDTEAAFGRAGVCLRPTLVRPPFGNIDWNVQDLLRKIGYRAIIWNADTNDWRLGDPYSGYTVSRIVREFEQQMDWKLPVGILALQHDLMQFSADLVPQIIASVQRRGLTYVSVDRCLWGPSFQRHPSYVFSNRFCPQSVANWPSVSTSNPCPVSDWSDWSNCDTSCGTGTQTRVRLTMPPSLKQTSAACGSVSLYESRQCTGTTSTCSTSSSCGYGEWTNWGSCSATCGGGTQIRTRTTTNFWDPSCGTVLQTQLCNMNACVGRRGLRGDDADLVSESG